MSVVQGRQHPRSGDVLVCEKCGMKIKVTADCKCEDGPHLECCGQPLSMAVAPTPPPERAQRS